MFRAAVLLFVLVLTTGPTTNLLCLVRCHPATAESSCHYGDLTASPRVTDENGCRTDSAATTAIVREGNKRGWPTSGVPQPVPFAVWLGLKTTEATPTTHASVAPVHGSRPRLNILRI